MMVRRDELLAAVDGSLENVTDFIAEVKLIQLCLKPEIECKVQGNACLSETVGSCSRKQLEQIWEKTYSLVVDSCQNTGEAQDEATDVSSGPTEDQTQPSNKPQMPDQTVEALVAMMSALLEQKEVYVPQAANQVAVLLKDVMSSLPATEHKVRNSIAKLFEAWWKKVVPGREELIVTSFVYIIERSMDLQPKPLIVDVRRAWSLHEVLFLINLDNEENEAVRSLLQRCFIYPQYLQHDEGLKFLGFVLSLDEKLTSTLHGVIKEHLPSINRNLHGRYSEVYFRAWQRLQGEQLSQFEEGCIQDLMYHAVRAQTGLFPALRKVLSHFHQHKKQKGVDAMLLRLYEPFIWRSLQAANHRVRVNATTLFFDVFPLQNPDMTNEENQHLLEKQFKMFQVLLGDPIPSIRAMSVLGVFQVMKNYWDIISQETLKALMVQMLQFLTSESSSAEVRVSVIKGLNLLLDNMLSHVFLKPLMAQLKNSFHDVSEKVRTAMLELLLKVKCLRTIKYWNVVPLEHLLARLVIDSDPVNKRIVKLLFSGFLPLEQPSSVQLDRCMVLLESNAAAARQFFRYAQHNMSVEDTVKYMLALCKAIIVDMKHQTGDAVVNTGDDQKENMGSEAEPEREDEETDEDDNSDVMSPTVLRGMCETICILWTGIKEDLNKESNAALKKSLQKSFSYTLKEMMKVYSDPEIVAVVVQTAGFLPANYIPTMSRTWVPKLRAMSGDKRPEDYCVLLDSLCASNRGPEIVELAVEWLQTVLERPKTPTSANRGKKKKKRVGFVDPTVPQPQLAVDYLNYIFQHTMTREKFLHAHLGECENVRAVLEKCMGLVERYLQGEPVTMEGDVEKFLLSALTLYCQILLLLHSANPEEFPCMEPMLKILGWADKKVLSCLNVKRETCEEQDDDALDRRNNLAYSIVESVLSVFNNLLLVGFADAAMCSQVVDFCSACVAIDRELRLLPAILLNLYQVTECVPYLPEEEGAGEDPSAYGANVIPTALSRIFLSIAAYVKNSPHKAAKMLGSVKGHIVELMKAIFHAMSLEDTIIHDVLATILAAILAEMKYASQELNLEEETIAAELPPLSNWLVDIVQKQNDLLRYFVEELSDFCDSGMVTDIHYCHGVIHLVSTLAKCEKLKQEFRDLCNVADRQTVTLLQEMSDTDKESQQETILLVQGKLEKCKATLGVQSED